MNVARVTSPPVPPNRQYSRSMHSLAAVQSVGAKFEPRSVMTCGERRSAYDCRYTSRPGGGTRTRRPQSGCKHHWQGTWRYPDGFNQLGLDRFERRVALRCAADVVQRGRLAVDIVREWQELVRPFELGVAAVADAQSERA